MTFATTLRRTCATIVGVVGLAAAPHLLAADTPGVVPVTWTVTPMTFTMKTWPMSSRGGTEPDKGYYPIRGVEPTVRSETVNVVVVSNGLIDAWVCPAWGGRLLRVTETDTKAEYFDWSGMTIEDKLPWNPGGVKASFPFFEHGLHLKVPAAWRAVTNADGSVTIASDMRFTRFTTPADIERYGSYGDESLDTMVTIRPGTYLVEWHQRKDNLNPTPRADRFWDDTSFPKPTALHAVMVKDKDGKAIEKQQDDTDAVDKKFAFIFPASWVVDHGPSQVHTSPHWSALTNWNVSHFGLMVNYPFAGGWYADENCNRLRIHDLDYAKGNAAKLWTTPGTPMFEIWGGHTVVFERYGQLSPAYTPVEFTHRYWIARGIGKVAYANAAVGVGIDGTTFTATAPRDGMAEFTDATGAVVAQGPIGPRIVLTGIFDGKKLMVRINGAIVADVGFPLDRPLPSKDTPVPPEVQEHFNAIIAPDPLLYEGQTYGRNQGAPGITDAVAAARAMTEAKDPVATLSLARCMQRLGQLDEAVRLANLAPGPDADFVIGLVALEHGEPTNFGAATGAADYLRAVMAAKTDAATAVMVVDRYLATVPTAWYPRLARAYWAKDVQAAQALAVENPASPEAQLVLQLLGEKNDFDTMVKGIPDINDHITIFRDQLSGTWKPLPRYPLPAKKK